MRIEAIQILCERSRYDATEVYYIHREGVTGGGLQVKKNYEEAIREQLRMVSSVRKAHLKLLG